MSSRPLVPPGACDCHMHVFEDRFALAPTATFKPPHAPADAYRKVQQALGLSRVVVVQPTGYAFDNRCTLEAMAALGPEARAIVVVAPGTSEAELARLDALGVRGVRYMMLPGGVLGWESLEATAARIDAARLEHQPAARRPRPAGARGHAAAAAAAGWRSTTSASSSARRPPRARPSPRSAGCSTAAAAGSSCRRRTRARRAARPTTPTSRRSPAALAERYPERCLWASNWPHPNTSPLPSEQALLEWTDRCIGNAASRQKILVDNPAALYRF